MEVMFADKTWTSLKNAIQEIQRKNSSILSFAQLYRNAYNMVQNKCGDRLYHGSREEIKDHLEKRLRPEILKGRGDNFLSMLNQAWQDHTISMLMIRDILMYMDRVYVNYEKVENVYNMGLILFRDEVSMNRMGN